jgi:hypothetical protein
MKKIYDRVVKIQIGCYGQAWENTSMWEHYCLKEETEFVNSEDWYSVFEDLRNRILTDNIYNASVEKKWGGERYRISLSTVCRDFQYRIHEPNKGVTTMREPIGIKIEYVEVKNPTLDFLSKNLSVEDMFEYLRERNIPFCPLGK